MSAGKTAGLITVISFFLILLLITVVFIVLYSRLTPIVLPCPACEVIKPCGLGVCEVLSSKYDFDTRYQFVAEETTPSWYIRTSVGLVAIPSEICGFLVKADGVCNINPATWKFTPENLVIRSAMDGSTTTLRWSSLFNELCVGKNISSTRSFDYYDPSMGKVNTVSIVPGEITPHC